MKEHRGCWELILERFKKWGKAGKIRCARTVGGRGEFQRVG